ncbi:DUF58 domain-containing protein [Natrinema ejinorense]|uniref:DUF58 domain-containing protein n=1 Tax=Natrinema ejinorense TaxID=373386 RepID=A0A2A5QV67_9EURY|nr:DUF58 domain-containing protein [Natrinema ejinorense]PCR90704.1 DUF58 domain-containing protein [Natrinema ejinorense]
MSETATERPTNRWAGVDAVAWAAAAVGLLAREPGVLLLAAVGVVFAAYARLGTQPEPEIRMTRELDDRTPTPGQHVTVRLTVENRGNRLLPDVRIVDGVPTALDVPEGSPHLGTVLHAGESLTHTYTIRAERGTHEFDPVRVVCRSFNGAYETALREPVETTLTCSPSMDGSSEPPLRRLVSHYGGQIPTDSGGSGTEFYGVRDYRPGDRVNRIDWARRARTGELTTLDFREERMATALLFVDARPPAYVGVRDDATGTHAVEWSVRAAGEIFAGLLDAGNRAGITAVGSEFVWLGPSAGETHRQRARDLLATNPTLSSSPPRERIRTHRLSTPSPEVDRQTALQLRRLEVYLPDDAQVLFCSPLADDAAVTIARRLQAAGTAVTVVSPDVTDRKTLGARVARLYRKERIQTLQRANVRVIDCQMSEPLAVAFERAEEGWQ